MANRLILIVEDSAADRTLYRWFLAGPPGAEYQTVEVETVEAAKALLERTTPDCILLDYLLPDGTGLDLMEALIARHGHLPFPVVMLTGEGSEAVAVEAMKAGVQDYAIKSNVTADALKRLVENTLAKARLQRELARRAEELEQLAYVVSHDLRAPLRSVHQNAELLGRTAGDTLGDAARGHLERILTSTRRMESLIVELVDYCRMEGARAFERAPLGPIIEQVLSDLEAAVVESGAEIEVGPLPAVWGDPLRLRQLFQNLIGNALEFHRGEAPRVVVEAQRAGEHWRISVADNGIGIDPKHFERIFGVFQRLPGASSTPGTGIGLAICRKIAAQHGSGIEVESQPGVGTTFSFSLQASDAREKPEEQR